jgi:uncharacterized lipoprotein
MNLSIDIRAISAVITVLAITFLSGCSKPEDAQQIKEDVSKIREIKEKEVVDDATAAEESRKAGEARIEKLKARLATLAASAPASAASS